MALILELITELALSALADISPRSVATLAATRELIDGENIPADEICETILELSVPPTIKLILPNEEVVPSTKLPSASFVLTYK